MCWPYLMATVKEERWPGSYCLCYDAATRFELRQFPFGSITNLCFGKEPPPPPSPHPCYPKKSLLWVERRSEPRERSSLSSLVR